MTFLKETSSGQGRRTYTFGQNVGGRHLGYGLGNFDDHILQKWKDKENKKLIKRFSLF